jgi:hypothetical protein
MSVRFLSGINVDSNTLFVDSANNRVGIGTASPAVKFVVSNAGASGFEVDPSGGVGGGPVLQAYNRSTSAYMAQSYYALSHTFNVGSGGSTRAVDITSSGNVGIGTTSPNGALHVASSPQTRVVIENTGNDANGAGLIMTVRSSGTIVGNGGIYVDNSNNLILYNGGVYAGNERVRINNSGYVGINTTAPSSFLTVSPGGSGNAATFTSGANLSTNYVGITLNSVTTSGVEWYGSEIRNINTGGTPGYLNPRLGFFTQNASTYLPADRTEKMSILGNGYVGVGTTTPNVTFETNGKVRSTRLNAASQYLEIDGGDPVGPFITAAGAAKVLTIQNNSTTNSEIWFNQAVASHYLWLQAGTEKMRLNSSGNLGIGTTSPSYKLDVYGDIRAGGADPLLILQPNSGTYAFFQKLSASNGDYLRLYDGTTYSTFWKNGNVGIGTTSPATNLHVVGTTEARVRVSESGGASLELYQQTTDSYILSSNALRFYNGGSERMRISSAGALKLNAYGSGSNTGTATQRLAVDASGNVIEIPIGSGPVDGNGTANYVTKWSDADTITNSIIYDNGTNVGIGSTIPAQKLQVNGAIQAGPASTTGGPMIYQSYGSPNYIGSIGSEYSSGAVLIGYGATGKSGASGYVSTFENFSGVRGLLRLASGSFSVLSSTTAVNTAIGGDLTMTTTFTVTDAGNVGIGTTSPGSKLQVEGTNPFIRVNNTSANDHGIKISYNGSDAHGLHLLYNANSAVSYIDNTYQAVSGQVYGDIYVRQNVGGTMTPRITIKADGGNVGIGTTTPASIGTGITTLDIQGSSAGGVAFGPSGVKNYIYGASTMYVEAHTTAVFATSGSEKMRLTTGGQLIVGGTTVGYAGTKLQVGNTSDAQNGLNILTSTTGYGYILFGDGAGADTYVGQISYYHGDNYMGFNTNGGERMRINSAGNVGIGTTSPNAKLDVVAADNAIISVRQSNAPGVSKYAQIVLTHGTTYFGANDKSYQLVSNSLGSGEADFAIQYWNGTSYNERMRVTSAGNVGIGTTSPSTKLQVIGAGRVLNVSSSNDQVPASFNCSTGGVSTIGFYAVGSANDYNVRIGANVDAFVAYTNDTERLRITSSGNVGIGTTGPSYKLHTVVASAANADIFQAAMSGVSNGFSVQRVSSSFVYSMLDGGLGINNASPTQALHVTGNARVTGAYYDSNNEAGTSGQVLSSTGSGTDWVTPATTTATSLYDLLPAARVAYNWTGQVVNDTWTTIFSKSDNILTTGTWMVQMYISDFAVGGGHYTYTYTGVMQWYQETVNQTGEAAFSEIYLHRMGHAANASVLYLRTAESGAAAGNLGYFQIKGNYSNTSNTTINFKFVKIF